MADPVDPVVPVVPPTVQAIQAFFDGLQKLLPGLISGAKEICMALGMLATLIVSIQNGGKMDVQATKIDQTKETLDSSTKARDKQLDHIATAVTNTDASVKELKASAPVIAETAPAAAPPPPIPTTAL